VLIPAGRIESLDREFSVVSTTDLQTVEQFENVVIATVNGYPVRLQEVAEVRIAPADERVSARFNGQPSLTIGVTKQSTANPLDLSREVRKEVALINENLPAGMSLEVAYDSSVFIQRSIDSRSEEHTSELQSRENLVCRLLLEKKNDDSRFI